MQRGKDKRAVGQCKSENKSSQIVYKYEDNVLLCAPQRAYLINFLSSLIIVVGTALVSHHSLPKYIYSLAGKESESGR